MRSMNPDDATGRRASNAGGGGFHIHISNSAALVLGASFLALSLLLVRHEQAVAERVEELKSQSAPSASNPRTAGPAKAGSSPTGQSRVRRSRPGPWGDLEYFRVLIERPDEFLSGRLSSARPTRWFFENFSPEELTALFEAGDLTETQRRFLTDRMRWQIATNGIFVEPGRAMILELSESARRQIYSVLADSPVNHFHHSPFLAHFEEPNDWFEETGLTAETEILLKRLIYQSGNTLVFSDLPDLISAIQSGAERKRLIKTLSRNETFVMKLRISKDSAIDELVGYWGKGGRAKDIRPLLESLARFPGGASIDVAHLMPPFVRRLLYTFPFPSDGKLTTDRNCFWTSLNFFNEKPDDRFCDFKFTEQVIQQEYYPIQDEPVFGDVVFLIDSREAVIHAAVFLADEKVFTKNGRDFTEPWKISDVRDLLSEYSWNEPVRPVVYRLKRL